MSPPKRMRMLESDHWMSAHDKIGLAGAVNALSAGHRDLIQR